MFSSVYHKMPLLGIALPHAFRTFLRSLLASKASVGTANAALLSRGLAGVAAPSVSIFPFSGTAVSLIAPRSC